MSIEKAREALSRKITSREEFEQALVDGELLSSSNLRNCRSSVTYLGKKYEGWYFSDYMARPSGCSSSFPYYPGLCSFGNLNHIWPFEAWPYAREALRSWIGVYDTVESFESALGSALIAAFGVHMSKAEPGMAAYTPDASAAAADKQVRIAPGRLLRKLLPHAPDGYILAVEADIRAEMSNELEIVTDRMEIMKVYTTLHGDTGCMRYKPAEFHLPKDLHPSMVYSGPGLGVAVVRDADGRPKARSVVYINPDNPADKRYVRLYGDPSLKRRLERNGFTLGSLAGAKLARIPHPDGGNVFVMPYIDPAGGRGYGNSDGRFVVDKGDHILAVSEDEYKAIRDACEQARMPNHYCVEAGRTDGRIVVSPMPDDLMAYTCAIDGQKYSRLDHPSVQWLPEPGAPVQTARRAAVPGDQIVSHVCRSGKIIEVRAPAGTPTFDRGLYVDDAETRERNGWWRLSPKHYPGSTDWRSSWDRDSSKYHQTADGWIKAEDTARVVQRVDGTDKLIYVHKSEIPDNCTMLWSRGTKVLDAYAAEGVEFQTTRLGRKVHPLTHDICKLWDDTWDFEGKCVTAAIASGLVVNVLSSETAWPTALDLPGRRDTARRNIAALVESATDPVAALTRSVIATLGRRVKKEPYGLQQATFQPGTTLEQIRDEHQALLAELTDQASWPVVWAKYAVELSTMALEALPARAPAPAPEQDRFAVAA